MQVQSFQMANFLRQLGRIPLRVLGPATTAFNELAPWALDRAALELSQRLSLGSEVDAFYQGCKLLVSRVGAGQTAPLSPELVIYQGDDQQIFVTLALRNREAAFMVFPGKPRADLEPLDGMMVTPLRSFGVFLDDHLFAAREKVRAVWGDAPLSVQARRVQDMVLEVVSRRLFEKPRYGAMAEHHPVRLAVWGLLDASAEREVPEVSRLFYSDWLHFLSLTEPERLKNVFRADNPFDELDVLEKDYRDFLPYFAKLHSFFEPIARYFGEVFLKPDAKIPSLDEVAFCTDLYTYLAMRKIAPEKTWPEAIINAYLCNHNDGLLTAIDSTTSFEVLLESGAMLIKMMVTFLGRHLAGDEEAMAMFGDRIARDFPEALVCHRGKASPLRYEEVSATRNEVLKRLVGTDRPHVALIGIGREMAIVERYVREGMDLTLIDSEPRVQEYFEQHQEDLRRLETEFGARIIFDNRDFRDGRLGAQLAKKCHAVELQNVWFNPSGTAEILDRWLVPGGVVLQYHPEPGLIDFTEDGYVPLIQRERIPAFLGTLSERCAYPTGVFFSMWRKPREW